ncbi:hypothetical protein B484DRAFT_450626 [Ochromonadaceae sp. CCMP2298]|nr:hypothetical protein B484DRAFT_450626 [Ochromonadaceae sp. CCMP2298]
MANLMKVLVVSILLLPAQGFAPCVRTRGDARCLRRASMSAQVGEGLDTLCYEILKDQLAFKSHPGFAYNLGCDEWRSAGYRGVMQSWSAAPHVRWLSTSTMRLDDGLTTTQSSDARGADVDYVMTGDRPDYKLDVSLLTGESNSVPHLRMSVAYYPNRYQVYLDYTPRLDILQSPHYYDQYFQGLDEDLYQLTKPLLDSGRASQPPPSASVLSRLLTSPFATMLDIHIPLVVGGVGAAGAAGAGVAVGAGAVDAGVEAAKIVKALFEAHVRRWSAWFATHATEGAQEQGAQEQGAQAQGAQDHSMRQRDRNIQSFLYDDFKFSVANKLGPDFAPKAEDVAAAIVGPLMISDIASASPQIVTSPVAYSTIDGWRSGDEIEGD